MYEDSYNKMFDLNGKVALITGSSKGIGLAIAWQMARSGASVVISSRKKEVCDKVCSEITKQGLSAVSIPCNVGVKQDVEDLVANTNASFGNVDILVCNAATNPVFGPLSEIPDDAFEKLVKVNIQSTLWLSKLVVPQMISNKGGSIILLSSIAAIRGNAFIGGYGMTKAAESALARNLAVEYGHANVRVNAISPGLVKTDFAKALWNDPVYRKKQETATPLRRIGLPEDIAGVAHFLASPASAYLTGQSIVVDGGETISSL